MFIYGRSCQARHTTLPPPDPAWHHSPPHSSEPRTTIILHIIFLVTKWNANCGGAFTGMSGFLFVFDDFERDVELLYQAKKYLDNEQYLYKGSVLRGNRPSNWWRHVFCLPLSVHTSWECGCDTNFDLTKFASSTPVKRSLLSDSQLMEVWTGL